MNRASPEHEAEKLWKASDPCKEDMPALLLIIAGHINNIKAFFSIGIINEETRAIINRALDTFELHPGQTRPTEVGPWPGTTFIAGTPKYSALLGSSNSLGAGYFLTQHETQVGENKYIFRITVFPDLSTIKLQSST
ncbi:hypothetical protein EJ02DRAFT_475845 [Clathrospora elynae]|uniref:Uncharacterized protein n=1 Tax=Clathrospora elynae TaxID=706981 RepID=A0A6A5SYR2_9PLEO|nr:hypothetical protein EJ02DRAFT_475845 [Clathrospora elynae]